MILIRQSLPVAGAGAVSRRTKLGKMRDLAVPAAEIPGGAWGAGSGACVRGVREIG
jgi:hypothetical protein